MTEAAGSGLRGRKDVEELMAGMTRGGSTSSQVDENKTARRMRRSTLGANKQASKAYGDGVME